MMQLLKPIVELQTYKNLAYLFLSFPLGILYFTLLITGLSMGFGLLIVWIGIPILALTLAGVWLGIALERGLSNAMLGTRMPLTNPAAREPGESFFGMLRRMLTNPTLWKGLAYLLLKFPFGILGFTLGMIVVSGVGSLLLAPLTYPFTDMQVAGLNINTLPEALFTGVFGFIFGVAMLWVVNLVTDLWRDLTVRLLASDDYGVYDEKAKRPVVHVPQPLEEPKPKRRLVEPDEDDFTEKVPDEKPKRNLADLIEQTLQDDNQTDDYARG